MLHKKLVRLAYQNPGPVRDALKPILKGLMRQAKAKSIHEEQFKDAVRLSQVDPGIAKVMVESGNGTTDKVKVKKYSGSASALKPSQKTMVLGKSLGMALFMIKTGKIGGDLGAIISKDSYIMDGHHRWSAAILAGGEKAKVGGYQADLPGKDLVRVLNILTKGTFKRTKGNPGSGDLKAYTPAKVKALLETQVKEGIPGEFPWTPEDVQGVLEKEFGSVEKGIETISGNASLITKKVPSWAPERADMPVLNPEDLPKAVQKLEHGDVDWHPPYVMASTLYKRVVRLAYLNPGPVRDALTPLLKRGSKKQASQSIAEAIAQSLRAEVQKHNKEGVQASVHEALVSRGGWNESRVDRIDFLFSPLPDEGRQNFRTFIRAERKTVIEVDDGQLDHARKEFPLSTPGYRAAVKWAVDWNIKRFKMHLVNARKPRVDQEKVLKALMAEGVKALQAYGKSIPSELNLQLDPGSRYLGEEHQSRSQTGQIWASLTSAQAALSVSVKVWVSQENATFVFKDSTGSDKTHVRVPVKQAKKGLAQIIDEMRAVLMGRVVKMRAVQESVPAKGALDPDDVTFYLKRMKTRVGGKSIDVDYYPSPTNPTWSVEPQNRGRLDHYGGSGWDDEDEDSDGWDSDGWEENYATPLYEDVMERLDDYFGKGLFDVEIGEKGHIDVSLSAAGRKALNP